MKGLRFLDEYTGQTTDQLIALEGKFRIDSLVMAFEQALQEKEHRIGIRKLSDAERTVLAIEELEREVNNGGYGLFFINSSKEFAPTIVDALNHIKCPKTSKITQKAIEALGLAAPITVKAIDRVMKKNDEKRAEILSKCDSQYYDSLEPIADRLFEFIKRNKDKVILA